MLKTIKTVAQYDLVPKMSVYFGSEHPDGSMEEFIYDGIEDAIDPLCYRDPDGVRHYFDVVG